MIDLSLSVGGHAGVISLVGLKDAVEVQGAVRLLDVLGKLLGPAVLVPLEAGRSQTLRLARNLQGNYRRTPQVVSVNCYAGFKQVLEKLRLCLIAGFGWKKNYGDFTECLILMLCLCVNKLSCANLINDKMFMNKSMKIIRISK